MIEIGTTPLHEFLVPPDVTPLIKTVKITYSQNDTVILEKRTDDCTIEPGKISTKLTQEDTFKIDRNYLVKIQIRALTHSGECVKSEPMTATPGKCLDDEVLT